MLVFALLYAEFLLLIAVGRFHSVEALLMSGVVWWLAGRFAPADSEASSAHGIRDWIARHGRSVPGLILGSLVLIVALRLCAGLALPPLGHDALLYHYLKAGRWVATGGWVNDDAPGPWESYEFFPFAGQAMWAWGMLPAHGDALVALAGVAAWLAVLLGAYAAARAIGSEGGVALAFAAAVGAMPAVSTSVTSGNVENIVLACGFLAVAFLARGREYAALAVIAVCMAAATKSHGLPLAAVGVPMGWICVVNRKGGLHDRKVGSPILLALIGLLLGSVSYLRAWMLKGSPLYPFALEFGGHTILPGNEEMTLLFSGRLIPADQLALYTPWESLRLVFWGSVHETWQHINLGLGGALLLLGGCAGLPRLWRRSRIAAAFVLLAAGLLLASVFSSSMLGHRTLFIHMIGRFVALPAGLLALGVLALPGRVATVLAGSAATLGVAMSLPLGLLNTTALRPAALVGLGAAALVALTWAAAERLPRFRYRSIAACAIGLSTIWAAAGALETLRGRMRTEAWMAAADDESPLYDMHPLDWRVARCWPIWAAVDENPGSWRIAFTSGFADSGHNAGRYPLMGSRLQHTVVYIPPTTDGEPLEPRLAATQRNRASKAAWLSALEHSRVDRVVSVDPDTIELEWMRAQPSTFEPQMSSIDRASWLFDFVPPSVYSVLP